MINVNLCHDDGSFAWIMNMDSYISLKLKLIKLSDGNAHYIIVAVSKFSSEEQFPINVSDRETAANIFEDIVLLFHLAAYASDTRDPIIEKCKYISRVPITSGLYDLNF